MALIIGWGGGKKKDLGPALPITCPNCKNQVVLHYVTVTSWLRLFFIPIIPYSTRHLLVCPVCTRALKLERGQVEQAKRLVAARAALEAGSTTEEYQREVQSLWASVQGAALPPAEGSSRPPPLPPPPSDGGVTG